MERDGLRVGAVDELRSFVEHFEHARHPGAGIGETGTDVGKLVERFEELIGVGEKDEQATDGESAGVDLSGADAEDEGEASAEDQGRESEVEQFEPVLGPARGVCGADAAAELEQFASLLAAGLDQLESGHALLHGGGDVGIGLMGEAAEAGHAWAEPAHGEHEQRNGEQRYRGEGWVETRHDDHHAGESDEGGGGAEDPFMEEGLEGVDIPGSAVDGVAGVGVLVGAQRAVEEFGEQGLACR